MGGGGGSGLVYLHVVASRHTVYAENCRPFPCLSTFISSDGELAKITFYARVIQSSD